MIDFTQIISVGRIACRNNVSSKKRALEWLSEMIAEGLSGITKGEVFESFFNRERLGSTGLGHGVAIPHVRLQALNEPVAAFLQLKKGVDYDAIDAQPVTLIFALLVPEDSTSTHLNILAALAEMFNKESVCEQLRAAKSESEIMDILSSWQDTGFEHAAGEH